MLTERLSEPCRYIGVVARTTRTRSSFVFDQSEARDALEVPAIVRRERDAVPERGRCDPRIELLHLLTCELTLGKQLSADTSQGTVVSDHEVPLQVGLHLLDAIVAPTPLSRAFVELRDGRERKAEARCPLTARGINPGSGQNSRLDFWVREIERCYARWSQ